MKRRKWIATLTSAAMLCIAMPVSAAEPIDPTYQIVVLGDSIGTGYGLAEGEASYVSMIEQETGQVAQNFSQNGMETVDLLVQLQTDGAVQEAVQNADVVLVSIGSNDVLQTALNNGVYSISDYNTMEEMMAAYTIPIRIALQRKLIEIMPPAVANANANIDEIIALLKSYNSNADIFFQTVYDPASIEDDTTGLPDSAISALNSLSSGQMYQFLEGSNVGSNLIPLGINQNLRNKTEIRVIDTYAAFQRNAWTYTNISNMDVHPNASGHSLIAQMILNSGFAPRVSDNYTLGDVDNNGVVAVEDAVLALTQYANQSAGNLNPVSVLQRKAGDIDRNGTVSVEDAVAILTYYARQSAGLEPSFF